MKYVHKQTNRVISSYDYDNLDFEEQCDYRRLRSDEQLDSSGDFLSSVIIGAVTDSAIIGGVLGGDLLGGVVGDMLDGDLFD
jgi:hypothetical protein